MWEIVEHALLDTLKMLPFLFVLYVLIELLETNSKARSRTIRLLNGKYGVAMASAVGVVPQCGFSVMASDLYLRNYIRVGTLIAVFVATSDEALPLLLANPETFVDGWIVVAVKIVYACILGYAINIFDKRQLDIPADDSHESHQGCCHHEMDDSKKGGVWAFFKHPVIHTVKITVYLIVINIVFGALMHLYEQQIAQFMAQARYLQPVVCSLVGLIPNCASSVVITQLYSSGIITMGAMISGLVTNSGIALTVLFRKTTKIKEALLITVAMYVAGVVIGLLWTLII